MVPYSGLKYLFYLCPFTSKVYKNPFVQRITILAPTMYHLPPTLPSLAAPSSPVSTCIFYWRNTHQTKYLKIIRISKQFLFFKIVAVVGGMAPQKQQRLLNKCPEIIVATPGRLWDLISDVSTSCIISCTDSLSFRDLKQSTHTCTCRYVSHEIGCPV